MAHQLPHMQNIALHEQSRPSPPPGLQGVAPPPGFSNQAGFSNPPIGFHHPQAPVRGAPVKSTPPPPGFGPSLMDQLQQPGTPSQAPPQNGKGPNSGGNGNGHGGQGQKRGPGGSQNLGMPPQQMSQQLPPQMFTTAAQLLDLTDKKLMVALRDGRKLHGILRSWDQFANLVLQSTVERLFTSSAPYQYCDIPRGTFLVRGENVLLLGEVDLDRDDEEPRGWERGDEVEVQRRWLGERKAGELKEKRKVHALKNAGFVGEEGEGVL